jgi:Xaa-Pro aminopeptidase
VGAESLSPPANIVTTETANGISYVERFGQVRQHMKRQDIDYLLVGPSTDLFYLVGYSARQSERLSLLIVPRDGNVRLVLPQFEVPRVEALGSQLDLAPWTEVEDPVELVASLIPDRGRGAIVAVGGQLHSHFTLRLQSAMPEGKYVTGNVVMEPVRMHKSATEIELLRAASAAADAAWEELITMPLVGITEKELLADIHRLLLEKGHDSVDGGIVGIGPNGASPHHSASNRRAEVGDAVVVDFGGIHRGYRSDITRTFHIGPPSAEFSHVYEIVRDANQMAFEAARQGVSAESVDRVAREHIASAGYSGAFSHRLGHGIGLDEHEPPYLVAGDQTPLEEGMVFSIEPGIYLSGRFGVRIEDIVVMRSGRAERLNKSNHDLEVIASPV